MAKGVQPIKKGQILLGPNNGLIAKIKTMTIWAISRSIY